MPRRIISVLIFVAFVILVEYWLGWQDLLAPWREQSLAAILAAGVFTLLTYWLRTVRLYDYFRSEIGGGFVASLKITLMHNLLNNLLPMRTGEISFPVLMHRHFGMNPARSTAALLWFRLLDLHALGLIALLAVGLHTLDTASVIALALAWLALPPLLHASRRFLGARFRPNETSWFARHAAEVAAGLPRDWAAFSRAWAWTLVNWIVKLGVFAWILELFVAIPAAAAWLGAIGGDLTSVLPVHGIAGAGSYEAGVVAALLPFGVEAKAALAAAVNLHLFVLGSAVLGGGIGLMLPGGTSAPHDG